MKSFIMQCKQECLRVRDTIVWFTCKRYEKMLFLEIY